MHVRPSSHTWMFYVMPMQEHTVRMTWLPIPVTKHLRVSLHDMLQPQVDTHHDQPWCGVWPGVPPSPCGHLPRHAAERAQGRGGGVGMTLGMRALVRVAEFMQPRLCTALPLPVACMLQGSAPTLDLFTFFADVDDVAAATSSAAALGPRARGR